MIAMFYLGAIAFGSATLGIHLARGDVFSAAVHGVAIAICIRFFWAEVRRG